MTVIPSNVKLRNNYGMELKAIGHVEEARLHYKVSSGSFVISNYTITS